jgi:adenosylcobinamide kinase/adenosylcobinamide-phosphate guanylyltransferase
MLHLVLGGARSGKSRYAEQLAKQLSQQSAREVVFIATATEIDEEMSARITKHQQQRPSDWQLLEAPLDLTSAIQNIKDKVILVDCLTLWLNNQMYHQPEQDFKGLVQRLADTLNTSDCDIILVSNEVGLGVIPMGKLSRQFVDQAGWMNQALAATADNVCFIAAGLSMRLKG